MRYSFHGKVRATGQQVDGFVEAASASQAIDRLADQGIIGVYSVRPEAKIPKNAVVLSGEASIDEEVPPSAKRPRLEDRPRRRPVSALPVQEFPPEPALLPAPAPQPVVPSTTEASLTLLVDKLSTLLVQVEKLLSRPQQIVYQNGPVRGGGQSTKKSRATSDVQNNTLRDIFQTNLDLRQSLEKLTSTVNAASKTNGEPATNRETPKPAREPAANGHELAIQSQPAA